MHEKKLIIIGASAMGRECCKYATDAGWQVKGFLDGRKDILDGYNGYAEIFGSVEDYEVELEDVFVCALGDPQMRKKYVEMMQRKGGEFVSVIHPLAWIGKNVEIGVGCIIAPQSIVTADTKLGNHVIINVQSSVSHDCILEDYATLSPGCHIPGWCKVHKRAFLGTGASVLPNVEIGEDVLIGAGAMVVRPADAGTWIGVPARRKQ